MPLLTTLLALHSSSRVRPRRAGSGHRAVPCPHATRRDPGPLARGLGLDEVRGHRRRELAGPVRRSDRHPALDVGSGDPGLHRRMSEQQLLARVAGLFDRHSTLLGFESGTLGNGVAKYIARFDTWYVEFSPLRDHVATYRGERSPPGQTRKPDPPHRRDRAVAPRSSARGTVGRDRDRARDRTGPAPPRPTPIGTVVPSSSSAGASSATSSHDLDGPHPDPGSARRSG